jgi:hypothetical protein
MLPPRDATRAIHSTAMARLVIHVGPHKTGSTSVQTAFHEHRSRLIDHGVFYPRPPAGDFPESHSDAAFLLLKGRAREFDAWLAEAWRQARAAACDVLLLSSEEFSNALVMPRLGEALQRFRRETGAELRPLVVQRPDVEHAVSSVLQHLTGEAGFFARQRYEIRRWACTFVRHQRHVVQFFTALGGQTLPLAGFPPERLAARLLEAGVERPFPDIDTPFKNSSAEKFGESPALLLSYPLRVMGKIAYGGAIVSEACTAPAVAAIRSLAMDDEAFARLRDDFLGVLREQIALGVADADRPQPLSQRLRGWLSGWARRIAREL